MTGKKIATVFLALFLIGLALFQDVIGQLFFHILGRTEVGYSAVLLVGRLIVLPAFLIVFGSYKKIRFSELSATLNTRTILLYFVAPLAVLKILPLIGLLLMSAVFMHQGVSVDLGSSWVNSSLIFVNLVILAPIIEEILFRGVLLDKLSKFVPPFYAITISSFVFSLLHSTDNPSLMIIFIFGIILAMLYRRTQNLAHSIILHASMNFFTFLSGILLF